MPQLGDLLADVDLVSRGFRIEESAHRLAPLLGFDRNLRLPVHRWMKFKEGFSAELVVQLLSPHLRSGRRSFAFLDPFCGVGTSLLAVEELASVFGIRNVVVRGIEINPFIHFTASTKLNWHLYNPAFLLRAGTVSANGLRLARPPSIPTLSTIRNPKFISHAEVHRLVELRDKIRVATGGRREAQPLLLGLASASETVLRLRKDGRALRYTPRVEVPSVDAAVSNSWATIAEDLQAVGSRGNVDYKVLLGDGRRADSLLRGRKFDVILFSPPYLNNIDYTEVYKVEQWLLGFLDSGTEMVNQRQRTFRSHPSCVFPYFSDARTDEVFAVLGPAFRRLVDYASRSERWRRRLFAGYFADMLRTLRSCRRLVAPRGRVIIVVGNSIHGTSDYPVPVATDVWIANLARAANLKIERIVVGRLLARRGFGDGDAVLRESIIEMTPR